MSDTNILGFIGTGVMGTSMAGHLLAAGNEVHVYNRTKERAMPLVGKGAVWEDTPADVAAKCDVVFTIVGFPKDVEEVYLGKNGLIENAKAGSVLVDMTTSSPKLARKIQAAGKKRGIGVLDAPVTGGDRGAREATLTIFAGGDKADFEKVRPYFEIMGRTIKHMGAAGDGQNAKLGNQIVIAGTMTGMCEALAFAKSCGLDLNEFIEAVGGGSAATWSLNNYGPRILKKDFAPGFFIKHYIKDMKLAEEAADEMELDLPALTVTRELYEELAEGGYENSGTQALYCLYDPEE
ncbi:MAG: NAD(P)-dependent oxidoreductase [bacterium]|nr:NAD(P)-dependent oxidoreductase [bacterium]